VVLILVPKISYSLDTTVKGFIALDALNYKKIERTKDTLKVGIGVLDLKIFAEQDNMTAAIKLNLDTKLDVQKLPSLKKHMPLTEDLKIGN